MGYKITNYSRNQARKLGVTIQPSQNPKKKIDVYKQGKKIASIGAKGYKDFPTYKALETKGELPKGYADKRRKLYKARHSNTITPKNKNAWYANKILW